MKAAIPNLADLKSALCGHVFGRLSLVHGLTIVSMACLSCAASFALEEGKSVAEVESKQEISKIDVFAKRSQFSKFSENVYVYAGRNWEISSLNEVNRFNDLAQSDLSAFTIVRFEKEPQFKRVAALAKTFDTKDYWYRICMISAGDRSYFFVEAFSVERTNVSESRPPFFVLDPHFPPDICYFVPYREFHRW